MIRRRTTTFYKCVSELSANSRWCLTGTPIQNRLEDIGALFTFIRASPFDAMNLFRRFIITPFEERGAGRVIASQRLGLLLDSVCLRRTMDLLHLPEQQNRIHEVEFSIEEREQYEQTKTSMGRAIRRNSDGIDRKSVFSMFHAQLQLRILCNHGTFQPLFSWARTRDLLLEKEDALCSAGQNGEISCSSCRQLLPILGANRVYRTYAQNCAHDFCFECLGEKASTDNADESGIVPRCPVCYPPGVPQVAGAERRYMGQEGKQENYLNPQGYSSKMAALISDVQQDLEQTKR
jgi:SWI/SNF-related matrix-associated actin-dependent regulator of chromatin subfamily A3